MQEKTELETKLAELLNRENREADSDTPDFLLAEFMMNCLDAFELASNKREGWYGVDLGKTLLGKKGKRNDKAIY